MTKPARPKTKVQALSDAARKSLAQQQTGKQTQAQYRFLREAPADDPIYTRGTIFVGSMPSAKPAPPKPKP
jgi:hypothetical protein